MQELANEQQPLIGRTIVVTRAREQASGIVNELSQRGASCLAAPAIRIAPLEDYTALKRAITQLEQYNWLIFTSVNGVEYFFKHLTEYNLDKDAFAQAKVAAIGVPTAQRLLGYGVKADIVPTEFRAEGIVTALRTKIGPETKTLIPRALQARDILPKQLQSLGASVDVVPVYQTVQGEADTEKLRTLLQAGTVDLITFTSSSTVIKLLEQLGDEAPRLVAKANIACIGPITAVTCLDNGLRPVIIAKNFTMRGLVDAIVEYYRKQ